LAKNTPVGMVPIEGQLDYLSQRVSGIDDDGNPIIVDYRPTKPGDEYVWSDETRRWIVDPDVAAERNSRAVIVANIERLEKSQDRSLREHALGKSGAAERLQTIDNEIEKLRGNLVSTNK
jgi:hypothetical protein